MLCLAFVALSRQLQQLQLQQAASDSPFQLLQILPVALTQVCATCNMTDSVQRKELRLEVLCSALLSKH